MRRCCRILGVALAAVALSPDAHARERRVQVDVGEEPLGQALIEFSIQANVSISTPPSGFGPVRSTAVRGSLAPQTALTRILGRSGYVFRQIDAVTFKIEPASTPLGPVGRPTRTFADEVIVTATRRSRTLDRLAASATVIESDDIRRLGGRDISDLAFAVAGLATTNLGPGRDKIQLRGLSDGALSGHAESTIGIYLDDSRITYAAPDPDLKLVDVARAEVLRGPQGALYGGGSIGGIYLVSLEPPDMTTYSGLADAAAIGTEGGGAGFSADAVANIPLVKGRAAVRVVGYRDEAPGWIDNVGAGLRNANETVREGVRVSLAANVGRSWSVLVRTVAQGIDTRDSQYSYTKSVVRRRATRVLEPHDNDFRLFSATVRGATPLGAFASTTTLLHHAFDTRFDAAGTSVGGAPRRGGALDQGDDLEFVTEEARLSAAAAPVSWSLGAFLSRGTFKSGARVVETASRRVLLDNARNDDIGEYAVFGDVTIPVARTVNLSVGLRAFRTDLKTTGSTTTVSATGPSLFSGSRSHTGFAPQLELSYEPHPGEFFYALAANGYRSGGFNTGPAVDANGSQPYRQYGPDELWSFELGAKRRLFAGQTSLRGALFLQQWKNVQTDQLIVGGLPYTGNLGDGRIVGAEAEFDARLTDRLRVSGHATLTDAELSSPAAGFPAARDVALPGAAPAIAGLSIDYRRPVGAVAVAGLRLGMRYVGASSVAFSGQGRRSIGDYWESSLGASVDVANWSATVAVDNLLNSDAATFSYGNPVVFGAAGLVTSLRPRTFTIRLARSF